MEDTLYITHISNFSKDEPMKDRSSEVITKKEEVNTVMMSMPAGDALPLHKTTHPTIVHFLTGTGKMNLDGKVQEVNPGSWIYMPAEFAHSVSAEEDLNFLLYVIKQ